MKMSFSKLIAVVFTASITAIHAEEKISLEQPKGGDWIAELRNLPDGVVRDKKNDDGSLKSIVVKATVEIEDALGASKGKQIAHKEAEAKCKQALVKHLKEHFATSENKKHEVVLVSKGESTKDAAGNKVNARNQQGTETKTFTDISEDSAQGILRGLIVLQSEVTAGKDPEYVLIMGLSQESMNTAAAVSDALSKPNRNDSSAGREKKQNASAGGDAPAPEIKTNPAAKGF